MMFLVDTNVFLEILLRRNKGSTCKKFLGNNIGFLNITDFSLHSMGVILFRYDKLDLFNRFIQDALPKVELLSLPKNCYLNMANNIKALNLDFDDAYQYSVAKNYSLKIVTLDKDFKAIEDLDVVFL